jgi:hypothetical protein
VGTHGCGFISPYVAGPGDVLCAGSDPVQQVTHVAIEDLPVLREALEAQLKEIQAAESEVKKQQRKKG